MTLYGGLHAVYKLINLTTSILAQISQVCRERLLGRLLDFSFMLCLLEVRQQQQLYNKFPTYCTNKFVGPTNLLAQQIVGNLLYVVLYGFFRTVVCCMLLLGFFLHNWVFEKFMLLESCGADLVKFFHKSFRFKFQRF